LADSVRLDERSGGWLVRAERQHGQRRGQGELLVKNGATKPGPEYTRAAAAQAWLGLAEALLGSNDWQGAVSAARSGIDELGNDYARPPVIDDTSLKLELAETQLQEGKMEPAANLFVRMLKNRLTLFMQAHPKARKADRA
jgi:hypothetical protein